MEWWQWMLVAFLPVAGGVLVKVGPVVLSLLTGKAAADRQLLLDSEEQRRRFETSLQNTIDGLRLQLAQVERDLRNCIDERATFRQQVADLLNRHPSIVCPPELKKRVNGDPTNPS